MPPPSRSASRCRPGSRSSCSSCSAIVLWRTTFGRYVYAAGGNAEAARLAGIRVNLVRISTFALTGLAAGLAGVIDLARTPSVPENDAIATTLTFTVLAGIVVGGTSILGGEGAIWRTVLGILFIAMLYNGFTLLQGRPALPGHRTRGDHPARGRL